MSQRSFWKVALLSLFIGMAGCGSPPPRGGEVPEQPSSVVAASRSGGAQLVPRSAVALSKSASDLPTVLADAESRLRGIEQSVSSMLEQRTFSPRAGAEVEQQLRLYADEMFGASQRMVVQTKLAATTQGKQGNIGAVRAFEELASNHEGRVVEIAKRLDGLSQRLNSGALPVDPQAGTGGQSLPDGSADKLSPVKQSREASAGSSCGMFTNVKGKIAKAHRRLSDVFVKNAEASVAAPCVPTCAALDFTGCADCVIGFGDAAIDAYNDFVDCWNSTCECKWYKPWCCTGVTKAWCVAKLVGILA